MAWWEWLVIYFGVGTPVVGLSAYSDLYQDDTLRRHVINSSKRHRITSMIGAVLVWPLLGAWALKEVVFNPERVR